MEGDTKERLEWLENNAGELSNSFIEFGEQYNKLEERHRALSLKFNSFMKAFLKVSDEKLKKAIFVEYQKNLFSKK